MDKIELAGATEAQQKEFVALQLENLKLENDSLKLTNESATRSAAKVLADPDEKGTFQLVGPIHEGSVHGLIHRIGSFIERHPDRPVEILLNSGGGSVIDGLALIDYLRLIRKRGTFVRITGYGMVASMASAILMAADERVVTSRCWIGLHEVSGAVQGSLTVQEDTTKFYKQLQDQVVDLYTERSNITKRTLSSRWKRKDVYVSSAEALKMGLVDKIEEV